jgi:hypothetical protein
MNNPTRCSSFPIVSKNQNWPRKITSWWAWGYLQVCRLMWRRRCSKSKVGKASSVLQNTRCLSPREWVCTASGGHPCAGRYAANEAQILDWSLCHICWIFVATQHFFCGYYYQPLIIGIKVPLSEICSGRGSGSQRGGCKGGWAAWDIDINTYVQTVGRSYQVRLLQTWAKCLLRTWVIGILNGVQKYGKVHIAVSERHKRTTQKVTLLQVKLCLVMVFGKCRLEAWDKAFEFYLCFLGGQASSNAMVCISDWEVAK